MEKQYLLTERAHLMCPAMHFAILFKVNRAYSREVAYAAIEKLKAAHPFLCSVIMRDNVGYYYDCDANPTIPFDEKPSKATLISDYKAITASGWDVTSKALLRITVYPEADGFSMLFIAHHLLCDGRGLLMLVTEFADIYSGGEDIGRKEERLIKNLGELPKGSSLPFISKAVTESANSKWKKEGLSLSYSDYLTFEKDNLSSFMFDMRFESVCGEELTSLTELCRSNGISVNDYIVAKTMTDENADKIVIAADIRCHFKAYVPGTLGNYSTAFSISGKPKSEDIPSYAKKISLKIKKVLANPKKLMLVLACYMKMAPGLIDAAAISVLGGFRSNSGYFVGANMFGFGSQSGCAVTNLGRITNDVIEEASFIPPMSPANRLTKGVITVNGKMSVCTIAAIPSVQSKITGKD